jgi:hypothetical protein
MNIFQTIVAMLILMIFSGCSGEQSPSASIDSDAIPTRILEPAQDIINSILRGEDIVEIEMSVNAATAYWVFDESNGHLTQNGLNSGLRPAGKSTFESRGNLEGNEWEVMLLEDTSGYRKMSATNGRREYFIREPFTGGHRFNDEIEVVRQLREYSVTIDSTTGKGAVVCTLYSLGSDSKVRKVEKISVTNGVARWGREILNVQFLKKDTVNPRLYDLKAVERRDEVKKILFTKTKEEIDNILQTHPDIETRKEIQREISKPSNFY